jgi:Tol biopolymer transport system component
VYDRFLNGAEGEWKGTFIADANGEQRLTIPVPSDGGLAPVWSPDGARLAVNIWSPPSGPSLAAIINPDGTGFRFLKPNGLPDYGCSDWSPDGATLLCSTNSGPHARDGIWSVKVDGTAATQLTRSPFFDTTGSQGECGGGDGHAVFSPDGKRFAFIRQKCGSGPDPSSDETGAMIIANRDGSGLRTVIPQGGVLTHPGTRLSWSPDGKWIVFGTPEGDIDLVHPDGSGLVKVPIGIGTSSSVGPVWSPDGTRIAFSTDEGTSYTVAPDGSAEQAIPALSGGEWLIDWGSAK